MSVESRALRILQVLVVGFVCSLAIGVWPSCGFQIDNLVDEKTKSDFNGGQFKLLHHYHHESPLHVPGMSLHERVMSDLQKNKERVAFLSRKYSTRRRTASTQPPPAPAPAGSVTVTSPVSPSGGSQYVMEVSIGTPPQTFHAIADTGSDLIWVQCAPCQFCDQQIDPLFYPSKSATYTYVTCGDPRCTIDLTETFPCASNSSACPYIYGYGDGTETIGDVSQETFTLTTTTGTTTRASNVEFGCGQVTLGNLTGPAGIVGLGHGNMSLTTQLGGLFGNKFSYCLVDIDDSMNTASPLLFGDSAVPKVDTHYTPLLTPDDSTFYYINLTGVNVNGNPVDIPPGTFDLVNEDGFLSGGVIVDSGTTLTYLDEAGYTPLLAALQSAINYTAIPFSNYTIGLDLCYNFSSLPINPTFPNISMVFEGLTLDLPQENILFTADNQGTKCIAFAPTIGLSIYGMIQQQNFQILFDRGASQFGFAKVECTSLYS